jgi:ATP-dependent Clp protease ATP-binding subunit ClpA
MEATPLVIPEKLDLDWLDGIKPHLLSRVIGQDNVLSQIADLIRQAEQKLTLSHEPLCRLILLGPTGVGKSLTAEVISNYVFGKDSYHRLDMAEFALEDAVKNFIGDHIGNVGSAQISKADPEYVNRTLLEQVCQQELAKKYGTEFIFRFQAVCVFNKLSAKDQLKIARLEIEDELNHLKERGHTLTYCEQALNFLYNYGCNERYGARPLRNTTQFYIRHAITNFTTSNRVELATGKLVTNDDQTLLTIQPN